MYFWPIEFLFSKMCSFSLPIFPLCCLFFSYKFKNYPLFFVIIYITNKLYLFHDMKINIQSLNFNLPRRTHLEAFHITNVSAKNRVGFWVKINIIYLLFSNPFNNRMVLSLERGSWVLGSLLICGNLNMAC